MPVGEAWWLHPPDWTSNLPTYVCAFGFVYLLGWLIQKLVCPQDTRHAIALGLVAGLLMTIVQFTFLGTGVGFLKSGGSETGYIHRLLAAASLGSEPSREAAVRKLYEKFPDLETLPLEEQEDMLNRLVSLKTMLQIPFLFASCLLICLTNSTIFCVASTIHAHRVANEGFGTANQFLRYSEVMIIFSFIGVLIIDTILYALGVGGDSTNTRIRIIAGIFAVFIASLPGLFLARWYYRWPVYVAMLTIALACFEVQT